ncbi:TetR/AcrR family transcriptional regulator [Mucilaginibacter robiniae]|uniref:TetR/AcrR family transcriptional regulator n=1 Tax=Mucilaginibacter robiniae TaxID=2728022 RepID=A0A7L5DW07_9SPHI|nr:TetR/AcrR family transcriptional regulator [Mucilaginibacter robiniae]QJD95272.1 TetR/AcrR family transcriptional regulator [Mucilaginibacter robiniae]
MGVRDTGAEQLIKDTAKRIFFSEGKLNATTQDIADAAGVTRTLVNYYFRSKDVLFEKVFQEAIGETCQRMDEVLASTLQFKKKIEKFIELFYAELVAYPYKEAFMISEINAHGYVTPEKERSPVLAGFLKEIQMEMDKGTVKKMKPVNFMVNLFSLMAYPLLTRTLFQWLFELSAQQYEKLLNERKKMIIDILFIN